jgi:hypothetical protein
MELSMDVLHHICITGTLWTGTLHAPETGFVPLQPVWPSYWLYRVYRVHFSRGGLQWKSPIRSEGKTIADD